MVDFGSRSNLKTTHQATCTVSDFWVWGVKGAIARTAKSKLKHRSLAA